MDMVPCACPHACDDLLTRKKNTKTYSCIVICRSSLRPLTKATEIDPGHSGGNGGSSRQTDVYLSRTCWDLPHGSLSIPEHQPCWPSD